MEFNNKEHTNKQMSNFSINTKQQYFKLDVDFTSHVSTSSERDLERDLSWTYCTALKLQ